MRCFRSWSRLECALVITSLTFLLGIPLAAIGSCVVEFGSWHQAAQQRDRFDTYGRIGLGSMLVGLVAGLPSSACGVVRAWRDSMRRRHQRLADLRIAPFWMLFMCFSAIVMFLVSTQVEALWDVGRLVSLVLVIVGVGKFGWMVLQ